MTDDKIIFLEHSKFTREIKKMKKKCPLIYEDLETFKRALEIDLKNNNYQIPTNTNKYSKVQSLSTNYEAIIFKRFRCMKFNKGAGSTPFRISFIYSPNDFLIYFAEFYFKEDKKFEDLSRLQDVINIINSLH